MALAAPRPTSKHMSLRRSRKARPMAKPQPCASQAALDASRGVSMAARWGGCESPLRGANRPLTGLKKSSFFGCAHFKKSF
jgi:hypothetical protein